MFTSTGAATPTPAGILLFPPQQTQQPSSYLAGTQNSNNFLVSRNDLSSINVLQQLLCWEQQQQQQLQLQVSLQQQQQQQQQQLLLQQQQQQSLLLLQQIQLQQQQQNQFHQSQSYQQQLSQKQTQNISTPSSLLLQPLPDPSTTTMTSLALSSNAVLPMFHHQDSLQTSTQLFVDVHKPKRCSYKLNNNASATPSISIACSVISNNHVDSDIPIALATATSMVTIPKAVQEISNIINNSYSSSPLKKLHPAQKNTNHIRTLINCNQHQSDKNPLQPSVTISASPKQGNIKCELYTEEATSSSFSSPAIQSQSQSNKSSNAKKVSAQKQQATTTATLPTSNTINNDNNCPIMSEKQQLLASLTELEQSIIIEMKRSKKFNFSKNVIKQFLKVINTQITYIYKPSRESISSTLTTTEHQSNSMTTLTHQMSNGTNLVIPTSIAPSQISHTIDHSPQRQELLSMRHAIASFLKKNSFTHASIKRVLQHQCYSLYFRDFLENHTLEWISLGKTKYKEEQRIMIEFLKLCARDKRLLVFLSGMDVKPMMIPQRNENKLL